MFESFFGGNKNQQQQKPAANQQQGDQQNNQQGNQQGNQQNANPAANSNNPAGPSNVNGSNTPADPTALYEKIWQNSTKQDEAPQLKLDGSVLDQVSGGMDFMQGAPEELVSAATNGDVKALMKLMNLVGQKAYRSSLEHGSALTDSFVGQREKFSQQKLGSQVREELTMNNLFGGEEGKQLPAYAKKQFSDIAKKIHAANPDASPEDVARATKDYLRSMMQFVGGAEDDGNSTSNQGRQQKQAETFDWDKWSDQS